MFWRLVVLLIEEIVILMVCLGFVKVGRLVCIVIVVMFCIFGLVLVLRLILKLCSMVLKFCLVNGFCLFVLGKFIIRLYFINWLLCMFWIFVIFLMCCVFVCKDKSIVKMVNIIENKCMFIFLF